MGETRITINELIAQMLKAARLAGYTERAVDCDFQPRLRTLEYYRKTGHTFYDLDVTEEFLKLQEDRAARGEISADGIRRVCSTCNRANEFFLTGQIRIIRNMHGPRYILNEENSRLIDLFLQNHPYSPNTTDDVVWVLRRYLYYLEQNGHESLATVSVEDVREYIVQTASEVKPASLHNILLYMKYFHIFLRENDIPAPDCVDLCSYHVCRKKHIQSYVTDEELSAVLSVIDDSCMTGKRDKAIIMLAATTGLRAIDIAKIRLSDIDWRNGQIIIEQQKTGQTVTLPLLKEAGDLLQDYIINARPASHCPEIFLRVEPPFEAIVDAASIGNMFRRYQKKAGIDVKPFDGKDFHGLRRRLAKKMIVTGTPLTTVAQVLGHTDPKSALQCISLDTGNLKECALDFTGIELYGGHADAR